MSHNDLNKRIYTKDKINEYLECIGNKEFVKYANTDFYLYNSLEKYPIANKKVLIFGSDSPSYESVILYYNGIPHTVDIYKITCDNDLIKTYTSVEFEKLNETFDFIFSISSVEHCGLTRYGDDLDVDGDLKSMHSMKKYLNKDGILFLSVPLGRDAIVWNAHRIYGIKRFKKLINGWKIIDYFGPKNLKQIFKTNTENCDFQPVFILKNVD